MNKNTKTCVTNILLFIRHIWQTVNYGNDKINQCYSEDVCICTLITAMDFFNQKEVYIITKNQTGIILEQGKKMGHPVI